jgi:hypothetical protein
MQRKPGTQPRGEPRTWLAVDRMCLCCSSHVINYLAPRGATALLVPSPSRSSTPCRLGVLQFWVRDKKRILAAQPFQPGVSHLQLRVLYCAQLYYSLRKAVVSTGQTFAASIFPIPIDVTC